jgi:hypothetical protein
MARKIIIPQTELQHHIALVYWFKLQYPQYSKSIMHFANGGYRNKAEAAKLKAMGVLAGASDLWIAIPRSYYHGLYIELKVGKGKLSVEQEDFIAVQRVFGYKAEVYWNWEDAKKDIQEYLNVSA